MVLSVGILFCHDFVWWSFYQPYFCLLFCSYVVCWFFLLLWCCLLVCLVARICVLVFYFFPGIFCWSFKLPWFCLFVFHFAWCSLLVFWHNVVCKSFILAYCCPLYVILRVLLGIFYFKKIRYLHIHITRVQLVFVSWSSYEILLIITNNFRYEDQICIEVSNK